MAPKTNLKQPKKPKLPKENGVANANYLNWPRFNPLLPTDDLFIRTVVEDQIVMIPNFWTATLCRTYVSFLSTLPLVTTPGKPKKGDALRVNDRYEINDPDFADRLWSSTALKDLVLNNSFSVGGDSTLEKESMKLWGGVVVGLNPRIRIYRYRKGQFFDQHYDESNSITLPTIPPTPAQTTWTLLIYLTSPATGCIGGETVFYPGHCYTKVATRKASSEVDPGIEPIVVGLETGMALLHRHGDQCMLHEGREVLKGEKWVIRSDLCVRRNSIKNIEAST